ncbi:MULTISPECIES: hypothetical protein [unclassified Streptomyces]|uniref:hypothetical protein n=1 Tax=unclassified Streptomyces TaxID=2593676 RepID=UPI0035E1E9D9
MPQRDPACLVADREDGAIGVERQGADLVALDEIVLADAPRRRAVRLSPTSSPPSGRMARLLLSMP